MEFREAARVLGAQITSADMAQDLGVSGHLVRQARLAEGAPGHRRPPEGWEKRLARLARRRAAELANLAEQLERNAV